MKIRTFLAAALCLALLPTIAAAENTVEALPTTAPMTEPAADVNEYAFDDLDPYYEDMDESQLPAFTENEKARFAEAQRRWDAGERPGDSILDVTENIRVSLVRLPAEQYDGHSWFLFLPYEELTDGEMLQIADAFGQLGIRFDPEDLSWRCCMRGGGIECTRAFKGDEFERRDALREQYMRLGLRPEKEWTADVMDDGVGEVTLDEDAYCGLDCFSFRPVRRLTDEDLLEIIARSTPAPDAAPDELARYEGLFRQELHSKLGMPLSAVREGSEDVGSLEQRSFAGDTRTAYFASFKEAGDGGRRWSGAMDISTGKIVSAEVELDKRLYGEKTLYSDVRMDPWDPHWAELAEKTVVSLLADGAPGIADVQAWCESAPNGTSCAEVRVTMADGAVCRAYASFVLDTVMQVEYNDALSMELEDRYYEKMMEEGNVNE